MADATIVFNINLSECPDRREWSYLELMQGHLAQAGAVNEELNSSLDARVDPRLTELAKSLERKYGPMVTIRKSGKRKKVRINDFLDIGEGYDTQDSFIDDSEAVDVYVAPSVSTKHGGFFVFEGTLEALEDEEAEIEVPAGTKPAAAVGRTVTKKNKSKELLEKAVKRLSAPKQSPGMPRNKMRHLDSLFDAVLSNTSADVEHPSKPVDNTINKSNSNSATSVYAKPTAVDIVKSPEQHPTSQKQPQSEKAKATKEVTVPPPLPQSLCSVLVSAVENFIKVCSVDGALPRRTTSKNFEAELLNLFGALKKANVTPSVQSNVFAHIEGVLQWNRKSLTRRLKKLVEASEDQKMNPLLDALSDAISRTMPVLLESYVRDKELHAERLKVWQAENIESTDTPVVNGDAPAPKRNPKPGPPKKLFRWNNECRQLFQSIVTLRLESYDRLNVKLPREEYLRGLFPTLIQLWPDGWITNTALWRAALPTFQKLTSSSPGSHSNGSASPAISPVVTSASNSVVVSGNVGTSDTLAAEPPCAARSKNLIQSISQAPCKTSSTPSNVSVTPLNIAPLPAPVVSTGNEVPSVCSTGANINTIGSKLNISLFANAGGDVSRSPQSQILSHSTPNQKSTDRTPVGNFAKQQVLGSHPPIFQSPVRMSHGLKHRSNILTNSGNPRNSLISVAPRTAFRQRSPIVSASMTPRIHVTSPPFSNQVVMSTQLVSRPSTVSSGTFRLPSISTIAGMISTKPTAAVCGKIAPRDPVDSRISSHLLHPRRQSEPIIISKPETSAVQLGERQYSQSKDIQNVVSQGTVVSVLKVSNSHVQPASTSTNIPQSPAIALTAHHVDVLQQGTISTSPRSTSTLNPALLVASTALIHRQPPPAHQQSAVPHCYYQRLSDGLVGLVSSTRADLTPSGSIQTDSGRRNSP